MKKKLIPLLLIAVLGAQITGCSSNTTISAASSTDSGDGTQAIHNSADMSQSDGSLIEIREKMFVAQTNEIYVNYQLYLGKTITYEGIFLAPEYDGSTFYQVIRYGPGCCGNDANAGFEISWDGEYPQDDDWVKVTGVLDKYEDGGFEYLILNLSSIEVLETRGEEYVTQ